MRSYRQSRYTELTPCLSTPVVPRRTVVTRVSLLSVRAKPSVRTKNSVRDESEVILLQACKTGHAEMVEELIRARVNVESTDEWGNTGLILAAMHGHTDVVHALLYPRSGDEDAVLPANANAQNKWAGTALIEAVRTLYPQCGGQSLACRHHCMHPHVAPLSGCMALVVGPRSQECFLCCACVFVYPSLGGTRDGRHCATSCRQ